MKHLLKQLITLVLILMTSISAWAGVAIGGVYYSTTGNIENEIITSGTVYLDAEAKTLTLTNAVINDVININDYDEFAINLVGSNIVTPNSYGIITFNSSEDCHYTIQGSGSLKGTTLNSDGIYFGRNAGNNTLTIKDCTLDITARAYGIRSSESTSSTFCNLVIDNATLYSKVKVHDSTSGAITNFKSITLTNCTACYPDNTSIYAKDGYKYGFWDNNTGSYATKDLMIVSNAKNVGHNITMGTLSHGTATTSVSSAKPDLVTVSTTPATGYVLSSVTVTDSEGNDFACPITMTNAASWKNTTATFIMPANAVTVQPMFTNDLTAAGGLFVQMPQTGNATISNSDLTGVTSFKLYDDGGKDGNYSNRCDGTIVIQAPDGKVMQLEGMVTCETSWDYAIFYQGTSTSDPVLGENKYSLAEGVDVGTLLAGKNLTVRFYSDGSSTYDGLDLTVTLLTPVAHSITVNSAAGGSATASVSSAIPGDIITLTASPQSGYVLTGYTINGGDVTNDGAWYSSTANFTMPDENVTVTPTFSNNVSNMFINMPRDGGLATTDVLPFTNAHISHFKIYDDGGEGNNKDQHSAMFSTGTLVLNAPAGKRIAISGRVLSESNEFSIYNGNSTESPLLYNENIKNRGKGLLSDVMVSSGESLTLVLTTSANYADIDFTAWYVSPSEEFNVQGLGATTGGTVSANKTSAKAGEIVTLTCTPNSNYKLAHVTVRDTDGRALKVYGGEFTQTTATFKMPGCAATVEATFTNNLTASGGLFISMAKTGTKTVTADQMEGVSSFRIYGDGSYNEVDTTNIASKLDITVAAGKMFSVEGNISSGVNRFYVNEEATENLALEMRTYEIEETDIPSNHMLVKCDVATNIRNQFMNVIVNVKDAVAYNITVLPATGGTASVQATALNNEYVTITATPQTGYKLVEFIVDGGNVLVTDGGFYNPVGTFHMPNHNITIQPVFTNNFTAAGGLYVNLKNGTIELTPEQLEGVSSFKVYDNGGSTNNYSDRMDCYLKINAPHHNLQVTGTVKTEAPNGSSIYDYLTVYDDFDRNTYLGEIKYSSSEGIDIGTLTSSLNKLMLYFHADSSSSDEGLDLTINLFEFAAHSITTSQCAGGTISAPSSAYPNNEVTITITADEGKCLMTLTINGVAVNIPKDATSYTFTMPNQDVTIVPTFADIPVVIQIPSSGSTSVNATSLYFKVMDANEDSDYENNWSGYLTVTVPEGCTMNIEGTCVTEGTSWDFLIIYDGANSNAPVLGNSKYGNRSGEATQITGLTTTSNVVTFWFRSDGSNTDAGPDLTITVNAPAGDGDVDEDGDVDNDDINAIARMAVKKIAKKAAADMNGDGVITVVDVTKAVNKKKGL